MLEHIRRARIVRLHHDAQTFPLAQRFVAHDVFDNQHGQFESFSFFRVDVQPHIEIRRQMREFEHFRQQFAHHGFGLCDFVARMQCGQFDRNTRIFGDVFALAMLTNRDDRIAVGFPIAPCVVLGFRALAEHVVGVGIAFFLQQFGVVQGVFNRLSKDELTAELFQNLRKNFVNHRFAHAANQVFQRANDARAALLIQHLFEQDQAARSGVDHGAVRLVFVRCPVFIGDFVFEQRHSRGHVGYAQYGFGQAHQRQTFGVRELVFIEHRLHPARCFDLAHGLNQLLRMLGDLLARHAVPVNLADAFAYDGRLVLVIGVQQGVIGLLRCVWVWGVHGYSESIIDARSVNICLD